jgi:hypothetical protein
MPRELEILAAELAALHESFPRPGKVVFKPLEPNLSLTFELLASGRINGTYEARPVFHELHTVSGPFVIDQSYLPALAASIRSFTRDATHGA